MMAMTRLHVHLSACAMVLGTLALASVGLVRAEPVTLPPDYPKSIERDVAELKAHLAQHPTNTQLLVKLSGLYLDMGEDLLTDKDKKIAAFEEGAALAKRALEIQEADVEAHYVYAANLGSRADLKGIAASLVALDDIKQHLNRALQLKKDHVPTLHMAGMILEELPSFMGGNKSVGLSYVKRAVELDPAYSHARLDLAKMYLKRKDQDAAKRELATVVALEHPSDPYAWANRYRPEAEKLLRDLNHTP